MAKVSKEELVKDWGHFFVLCATYGGKLYSAPSPEGYGVGNLGYGWKPTVPDAFVIKEFLGKRSYASDDRSVSILSGRSEVIFSALSEAQEALEKRQEAIRAMYAELRKLAKSQAVTFDLADPVVPVKSDILPDEVEVENLQLFKQGGKIVCMPRDVFRRDLQLHECKIEGADLEPFEPYRTDGAQKYHYKVNVFMAVPDALSEKPSSVIVTVDFKFDPENPSKGWTYNPTDFDRSSGGAFQGGVLVALTMEAAERQAREFAERTLKNIQKFLPAKPTVF